MKSVVLVLLCSLLVPITAEEAAKPLRIICIGDSITQADQDTLSWRYALWKRLLDADTAVDFVGTRRDHYSGTPEYPVHREQTFDRDHEALWGISARQMSNDLPVRIAKLAKPIDLALVHIGTNDALMGRPAAEIINHVKAIVTSLRQHSPAIRIHIAQIAQPDTPRGIPAFNAALPAAAATWSTADSPVSIVDLATGFSTDTLTWDGLHPNEDGEQWLADRWFRALQAD